MSALDALFAVDPTPCPAQSPAPLLFLPRVSGMICHNNSAAVCSGIITRWPPSTYTFSLSALGSRRLHERSRGLLAVRSRGGRRPARRGGEPWNTSPCRFSACNRSAWIRNLKSEERGRPGGGHGELGEVVAGDRALRGRGVLRISDGALNPAKQTEDRVSASPGGVGTRTKRPHCSERVEHPLWSAGVSGLGAASCFPGALTVFPAPLPEFGGSCSTFGRCPGRLSPFGPPRQPQAHPGEPQFRSAVPPTPHPWPWGRELDRGSWWGFYLAWVATAWKKGHCSPLLSGRNPLTTPPPAPRFSPKSWRCGGRGAGRSGEDSGGRWSLRKKPVKHPWTLASLR